MINYILICILIVSLACGTLTGNMENISGAFSSGAAQAVTLCLSMGAVIALWSGIIRVAEKAGLTNKISFIIFPFIKFLFPEAVKDKECKNAITINITSNILGLGNAATPMGIKALKKMTEINGGFSKESARFLVLNCASVQIIPTTVAAIRSSAGSAQPFDIIVPVWIVSSIALVFGLLLCELLTAKG